METKPFIIGIAGGTGAGKTTFAKSIYVGFGGTGWGGSGTTTTDNGVPGCAAEEDSFGSIAYLSHDHYYKDLAHLPMEDRAKTNFDHPNSLDTDLLIRHLEQLLEGKTVVVPRYDFKRHCRYQEGEVDDEGRSTGRIVESKRIVLVEGILIFSVKALVDLMDLKIFVVSHKQTTKICLDLNSPYDTPNQFDIFVAKTININQNGENQYLPRMRRVIFD